MVPAGSSLTLLYQVSAGALTPLLPRPQNLEFMLQPGVRGKQHILHRQPVTDENVFQNQNLLVAKLLPQHAPSWLDTVLQQHVNQFPQLSFGLLWP